MERNDTPAELHTEADNDEPLTSRESAAMGMQSARTIRGVDPNSMVVYGDVDEGFDNQDQADSHHAEPDEHL